MTSIDPILPAKVLSPYGVRIRPATMKKQGAWYALWVEDIHPGVRGVTQIPVHHLWGAWGDTPAEAYNNLMEVRQ